MAESRTREQGWAELHEWGRERELGELDALMWRTERHPANSWTGVVLQLLDEVPDWDRLRSAHEWFVSIVPRFRERVVDPALPVGTPMWAPDPAFDLGYHLRRTRLPEPGTRRQLLDLAQSVALTPLDRSRPPWAGTLVEGLADGRAAYLVVGRGTYVYHVATDMSLEHVDVLIVGAGLSGIGAGYHLQAECPGKSYAILEARDAIGGTWDLFRYPGIRSDSDMYTLGYSFRPWTNPKAIADGSSILEYVRQTASDYAIEDKIRFNHRVVRAEWSTPEERWTVHAERTDTGETVELSCSFLLMCSGYYRYDEGYTPDFEGTDRFAGQIVHPQHWTDDVDYAGKRVVVIGSGATAVTLVPALAERAAHVTMLQRSPSYIVSLPEVDPIARLLRRLPAKLAYSLVRWKNVLMTMLVFQLSRRRPKLVKAAIRRALQRELPPGYDIDAHFKPRYNPWDQRMCLVPNGDLFAAIRAGTASVVTDQVDTFTENGLKLASGTELEADVVVTATGLNLLAFGGIELSVDGAQVDLAEKLSYKGMMLNGVPNLAAAFGYTNASWTLKCDLTCAYVCRLLNHMDERGYGYCTPQLGDPSVRPEPFVDFSSSYVLRSIDRFPKQGSKAPWRLYQNYALDIVALKFGSLEDGTLQFAGTGARVDALEAVAA